jgi:tungstate transport system permease protein
LALDAEVWGAAQLSLWLSAIAVLLAALPGIPLGALLGLSRSRTADALLVAARVGMASPTVVVGLLVYGVLSRRGPLGAWDLLYSPTAIIAGEVLLAFPLVVALTASSVAGLDPRFRETVKVLRLGRVRATRLAVRDARDGVLAALLVAFARCVGELGVALLVGGNLRGSTRTLTTAIALETSRGEFERAVALGVVLLVLALGVNAVVATLFRGARSS